MSLSKNILATLAYYDTLEYPLTAFETWWHLVEIGPPSESRPVSFREVVEALEGESVSRHISFRDGFYFLRGRGDLVDSRLHEEKLSVSKLKRVRSLVRLLSFIPFVRMVGVTGSLAMKKSERESDWDLFVVLRAGRIWAGRTFLTGFLHFIGKRRHGNYTKDRACLNYYVTEDALEIGTKDLFSAHEYRFIIPMLGVDVFRRFELRNRWIQSLRPNFHSTELPPLWLRREPRVARYVRVLFEIVFGWDWFESWLSRWQKKKIARNPKTSLIGGHIEATHQALIFLPKPKGPRVFERFMETFGKLQLG